jgi:hypothetical protein
MVPCLFFNFAEPFDFGCCSLAQEMNFVVHYVSCFKQWRITCPLSAFLPFQCLFIGSLQRLAPCSSPFSGALAVFLSPLVFSLFIVQFFFFLWKGVSVCPEDYAGLSHGWLREYCMMLGAHLFGLLNVSQAGLELEAAVATVVVASALLFSQCNVV